MRKHIELRAPVNTGNRYCGPAVISSIAGIGTGEAAREIRRVSGQRAVRSTSYSACRMALRNLGFATKPVLEPDWQADPKLTVSQWLRRHELDRLPSRVFLMCAGRHWFIISGQRYVCGKVKEIVPLTDPRIKTRVIVARAYEVIAM